jgi:hypothetical protein
MDCFFSRSEPTNMLKTTKSLKRSVRTNLNEPTKLLKRL